MTETDLQRQIQVELSTPTSRLWRNNSGNGWVGSTFSVVRGHLVSGSARRIQFGLCPGSSDLIGPTSVVITPEMVGRTMAVFTAIEVKNTTKLSEEQRSFIEVVSNLGGLSGVARSVDEAHRIVMDLTK